AAMLRARRTAGVESATWRIGDTAIRRNRAAKPPNRQTANHAARRACGCFAALAFAALHAIPNIDHAQPRPRAARS
ncbi:hypothetical protein PI859_30690, partial [Burkholderia pseudomallei]|uniref:hypothetical protein n=1 Tax=Burkholderia pseudomallei TaxID=28450 RepID=UPI0022FF2749